MRIILSIGMIIIACSAFAQQEKYNTKINNADKVNIKNEKGGIVIIYDAKNIEIGKIFLGKEKTKIFLKTLVQSKDTSGSFITAISFSNPDNVESENTKISVKCNTPISKAKWGYGTGISISFGVVEETNLETGEIKYSSGKLSANSTLILTIKSPKPFKPVISGIDGKFK